MTNDEARILMERILLVPVAEVDAALILAGIEERLRNERAAEQNVQRTAENVREKHHCRNCDDYEDGESE